MFHGHYFIESVDKCRVRHRCLTPTLVIIVNYVIFSKFYRCQRVCAS